MWAPDVNAGVQLAAVKFLQKVILVQSRGIADPRVSDSSFRLWVRAASMSCSQKLQNKNDPNLAIVPGDHPFINAAAVAALETEGVALLQRLITDLYTKQYVWPTTDIHSLLCCVAHTLPFQKPGSYICHSE